MRKYLVFMFLIVYSNTFAQYAQLIINIEPRNDYKKIWKHYDVSVVVSKHPQAQYAGYLKYKYLKTPVKSWVFDSLNAGIVDVEIGGADHRPDTIIENVILVKGQVTALKIIYPPYCQYDAHVGNDICPKCKKNDQVLTIHYGEPITSDTSSHWMRTHYLGGCRTTGCDPTWYCQRDDLKF